MEKEQWKAINDVVDYYKNEMIEFRDKYYKLKEQYNLLYFDILNKNFDNYMYHGYTLKELLECKLKNIEK